MFRAVQIQQPWLLIQLMFLGIIAIRFHSKINILINEIRHSMRLSIEPGVASIKIFTLNSGINV